jgi:hypothetical protein
MSDVTAKTRPEVLQQLDQVNAEAFQVVAEPSTKSVQNRIPLTVRRSRVMRVAPPIDDGFRPFRVF